MLVLDYNEDRSLTLPAINKEMSHSHMNKETMNLDPAGDLKSQKAKIQIETLANFADFGGGKYKMTAVKRMTATTNFLEMPIKDRHCDVELFQDCRTRRLLKACNCVPWEIQDSFGQYTEYYWNLERCTPKGRACIESKSTHNFNCTATCEGLHADVSLEKGGGKTKRNLEKI